MMLERFISMIFFQFILKELITLLGYNEHINYISSVHLIADEVRWGFRKILSFLYGITIMLWLIFVWVTTGHSLYILVFLHND